MSNAILPHVLAVFAVGSTLVYSYDLRPIYDTEKYCVREEWKVTRSGQQYHVVVNIPRSKKNGARLRNIWRQSSIIVWKRKEYHELVYTR